MLVLTSNKNRIDSDLMMKAIRICEEILDEAKDKFQDDSLSSQYSFADYLLANLKHSLSSKLHLSEELADAMIDFFDKSELIDNGCLSLKDLSLKGETNVQSSISFLLLFLSLKNTDHLTICLVIMMVNFKMVAIVR